MDSKLLSTIDKIFIDRRSLNSSVAERAQNLFPPEKVSIVDERPYANSSGQLSAKEFNRSKKEIFITEFQGRFFKQCPGFKPGLVCCNYFVLNLGLQCNMNCSYCYLQSYINTPLMTIYSNIDSALEQLKELADKHPDREFRVGTGETIDSLSLDEITLYSRRLISFFNQYPRWSLEFKTKSDKVDQFLDLPHVGNTIVSWSINPQYVIDREEHQTASLAQRLGAARKCLEQGFKVNFHMDPLVWHPEWKENYFSLVDTLTSAFTPSEVGHVSLGTLRFQPEQRHIMRERFGMKSLVTQAEVFASGDGKMRYDLRLRSEMFNSIMNYFKSKQSGWKVLLCMETPETWISQLGINPRRDDKINPYFEPLPRI